MKTAKMLTILVVAFGLLVWATKVSKAVEMGTAFTYQGHLYDANHVADGIYDFAFKLYDANVAGSKVGTDVNISDVDVIDGYFTVELDFGSDVFTGDGRWLEIGVRPGELEDPNVYTVLVPRQELTPTPCAIRALRSNDADTLDGLNYTYFATASHNHSAADITSGTLSNARFSAHADLSAEGYLGNASSDIAQNNGTLQTNLNADMLDGYHAGSFLTPGSDYGRSGVASNLYEGTTALSNKYLGKTATATNSDKVDGYHAGNSSNQVAVSNGSICTNLNADKVDGYDASDFIKAGTTNSINDYTLIDGSNSSSPLLGAYNSSTNEGSKGLYGYGSYGVFGEGRWYGVYGEGLVYDFYAAGPGTDYGSASSIRWKSDIRPIDDPLDKVLRLRGVYFNWDEEHGGHHDLGMIAEEVGEVLPEIVDYEENGTDAVGMDYSKLTPLLIEAVKALNTEIAELKDQLSVLESLQKENTDLRNRIEALEKMITMGSGLQKGVR